MIGPQTVEFYRAELANAVYEWRRDFPNGTPQRCQRELEEIEADYVRDYGTQDLFPPTLENILAVWDG